MKARRRGTTRDMMVIKTNGAPTRPDAPAFIGGAWTPETVKAFNGLRPGEPSPTFEVVREHPATGRSQLAGWGIADRTEAEALAAKLNDRMAAAGGFTLATSGLLERGWTYRSRRASS